jgi:hypothetical protein
MALLFFGSFSPDPGSGLAEVVAFALVSCIYLGSGGLDSLNVNQREPA